MKYTANFFQNVLINSLGYEQAEFGSFKGVKMSPIDAFRYCVISNSGYLDVNQIEKRLIIRKDLFRVFNQAEQESIQHGIFDRDNPVFKYTPNLFFEKYPDLMTSDKVVLFVEYNPKEKKGRPPYYSLLESLNEEVLKNDLNPHNFVVTLVPNNNNPRDLESFFEFYINERFRRRGFLTDSQLPFYYGVGTPDAGVYSNEDIRNQIFAKLNISGATIIDLMCLKYLKKEDLIKANDMAIVFEVKTGSTDGSQIIKYEQMNVFDEAYEVIPHKVEKSEYAGLISFDEQGKENVQASQELNNSNINIYYDWLYTYIKCFLMTNMCEEKFESFKKQRNIKTTKQLIDVIKEIRIDDLIDLIKE